jgi:hypothetical protein
VKIQKTFIFEKAGTMAKIFNIRKERNYIVYDMEVCGIKSWVSRDCSYASLLGLISNLEKGGWK